MLFKNPLKTLILPDLGGHTHSDGINLRLGVRIIYVRDQNSVGVGWNRKIFKKSEGQQQNILLFFAVWGGGVCKRGQLQKSG